MGTSSTGSVVQPEATAGPVKPQAVADAYAQLSARLRQIPGERQDEWLRMLYNTYSQRYAADGDRIWITGAVMIPLSLGTFIALTQVSQPTTLHILLLALVSILLMVVWLVISEAHRAQQQESRRWIQAIGLIMFIEDEATLKSQAARPQIVTAARAIVWGLLGFEVAAWLIILVAWPRA